MGNPPFLILPLLLALLLSVGSSAPILLSFGSEYQGTIGTEEVLLFKPDQTGSLPAGTPFRISASLPDFKGAPFSPITDEELVQEPVLLEITITQPSPGLTTILQLPAIKDLVNFEDLTALDPTPVVDGFCRSGSASQIFCLSQPQASVLISVRANVALNFTLLIETPSDRQLVLGGSPTSITTSSVRPDVLWLTLGPDDLEEGQDLQLKIISESEVAMSGSLEFGVCDGGNLFGNLGEAGFTGVKSQTITKKGLLTLRREDLPTDSSGLWFLRFEVLPRQKSECQAFKDATISLRLGLVPRDYVVPVVVLFVVTLAVGILYIVGWVINYAALKRDDVACFHFLQVDKDGKRLVVGDGFFAFDHLKDNIIKNGDILSQKLSNMGESDRLKVTVTDDSYEAKRASLHSDPSTEELNLEHRPRSHPPPKGAHEIALTPMPTSPPLPTTTTSAPAPAAAAAAAAVAVPPSPNGENIEAGALTHSGSLPAALHQKTTSSTDLVSKEEGDQPSTSKPLELVEASAVVATASAEAIAMPGAILNGGATPGAGGGGGAKSRAKKSKAASLPTPIRHEADKNFKTLKTAKVDNVKLNWTGRLTVNQLDQKGFDNQERKGYSYVALSLTIVIFYGLLAVQISTVAQRQFADGDEDTCAHNFFCANQLRTFRSFNNLISNASFLIMGTLLLLITIFLSRLYWKQRAYAFSKLVGRKGTIQEVEQFTTDVAKCGIAPNFFIYYTLSFLLMAEGIFSGLYHVCPTKVMFQFDTTFMYAIVIHLIVCLYQKRHPDLTMSPILSFFLIGLCVMFAVVGIYFDGITIWIVAIVAFFSYLFLFCLFIVLNGNWRDIVNVFKLLQQFYKIQKKGLMIFCLISFVTHVILTVLGAVYRPAFASFILGILIVYFLMYLAYYIVMKKIKDDGAAVHIWKPVVLFGVTLFFTAVALYFFTDEVTKKEEAAMLSRELNRDCAIFRFYDAHDIWHMFAAFGLFFASLSLLYLDVDLVRVPRDEIVVF